MKETCEFRIVEKHAHLLFRDDEGTRLGNSVRKVTLRTDDPRFAKVRDMQAKLRQDLDESFFHGWWFERSYSKKEMDQAEAFHLIITRAFEPSGEECGTEYDLSKACPKCGTGRIQTSPLILEVSKIPKGKDISRTIGEEIVVSRKLADAIQQSAITGVKIRPILNARTKEETRDWFQLILTSRSVNLVPPTRFGTSPFDEDESGEYRCVPHVAGLNILSQLYVESGDWGGRDINGAKQLVGWRAGLLVPAPVMIVSRWFFDLVNCLGIKGCKFEVVQFCNH